MFIAHKSSQTKVQKIEENVHKNLWINEKQKERTKSWQSFDFVWDVSYIHALFHCQFKTLQLWVKTKIDNNHNQRTAYTQTHILYSKTYQLQKI